MLRLDLLNDSFCQSHSQSHADDFNHNDATPAFDAEEDNVFENIMVEPQQSPELMERFQRLTVPSPRNLMSDDNKEEGKDNDNLLSKTTSLVKSWQENWNEAVVNTRNSVNSIVKLHHKDDENPKQDPLVLVEEEKRTPPPKKQLPNKNLSKKKTQKELEQQHTSAFATLKENYRSSLDEDEIFLDEDEEQQREKQYEDGEADDDDEKESQPRGQQHVADIVQGKQVSTPYGSGEVVGYRAQDDIYVVRLYHASMLNSRGNNNDVPPGKNSTKLYCKLDSFSIHHENHHFSNTTHDGSNNAIRKSMELNDAYEALEKMRRLNLEVECNEKGISKVDFTQCTACLLQTPVHQKENLFHKFVQDQKKRSTGPCLICASPACKSHSCPKFRKKAGITVCSSCVRFFDPEFVEQCCVSNTLDDAARQKNVGHMIDLYDRVILLLRYSSQYIESIAVALKERTVQYNNANVGSSSAGIVSGALGVAAAATIFTPAGPPLVVASLLFGGGATAVQTSTEAVHYNCEPNRLADKIISLMGMAHSLLKVRDGLREAVAARLMEGGEEDIELIRKWQKSLEDMESRKVQMSLKASALGAGGAALGGAAFAEATAAAALAESSAVVAGAEYGAIAGQNASLLSRTGTAVSTGARFARVAGGALAAAALLWEARNMVKTIEKIQAGHPCEKADALRAIASELPDLPATQQLEEECTIYDEFLT